MTPACPIEVDSCWAVGRYARLDKTMTPQQRAYLLGYRCAKARCRAKLREMQDHFDDPG